MNSHVKFIFFLLLYHSPPQKASERTGKSGPTFQHLHRLNHHQFVRYLVVEIWHFASGFFPSSSSIPTLSSRVDFLFSINYCCLYMHQKLLYTYICYKFKAYLFYCCIISFTKSFWKNCMARADWATPPSPGQPPICMLSLCGINFFPSWTPPPLLYINYNQCIFIDLSIVFMSYQQYFSHITAAYTGISYLL